MICKKCGASVPDNSYECPYCKAKLSDIAEPEKAEDEIIEEQEGKSADAEENVDIPEEIYDENEIKRREQIRRMMEEKKQQLSEIQDRREQKRRKQQRIKIALVALICVLAAGVVGATTYLIRSRSNNAVVKQTDAPTQDPAASPTVDPLAVPDASALPSALPSTLPMPTDGALASSSGNAASGNSSGSSSSSGGSSSGSSSSSGGSSSGSSSSGSSPSGSSSSGGSSSGKTSGGSFSGGTSGKTSGSSSGNKTGSSSGSSSSGSSGSSSGSSGARITNTGIVTSSVNGILAKGGEVIYDNNSGRYIMTFISNNKEYYAFVSPGSTTDQIYGKSMTITASPTKTTFRGSTVFDISSLTRYDGKYILKDSGTRPLTNADVAGLSKEQVALARNEIYARHGRPFSTPKYKSYFESCSWYKADPNYDLANDSALNQIERDNADFLLKYEQGM